MNAVIYKLGTTYKFRGKYHRYRRMGRLAEYCDKHFFKFLQNNMIDIKEEFLKIK